MVVMRWFFTGLSAVSLAAALTVVAPVPAQAFPTFMYHEDMSEISTWPHKNAIVQCPPGQIVYGFGGRVGGGNGDVALIAISPDQELTSVTAVARARSTSGVPWAVFASVVCGPVGLVEMQRVVEFGSPTAQASCTSPKMLYSNGYIARADEGNPYVDKVVPSIDVDRVTVHAGGVAPDALQLAAVALCGLPMADLNPALSHKLRLQMSVPVVEGAATVALAPAPQPVPGSMWVMGAGVQSTRPGMFIDGLGPIPALNAGWARMAPGTGGATGSRSGLAGVDDGEGDEVTSYGVASGFWY